MRELGTLLLHVGTHKTATTSLQTAFSTCEQDLAASDILYPRTGRIGSGHHNIAWGLAGDDRFDPASGYLDELGAELQTAGLPRVLISSEDFEYLYNKHEELSYFKDLCNSWGYDPHIVLVFREQSDYINSLYAELLKHGLTETYDEFVTHALAEGGVVFGPDWNFRLDYLEIVEGFGNSFGPETVTRIPYDRHDMVGRFLGSFRSFFGDAADRIPTELRENTRLVPSERRGPADHEPTDLSVTGYAKTHRWLSCSQRS